ncbi:MAG: hypothetical protein R3E87_21280 [Burkholderiaceae bacterium]
MRFHLPVTRVVLLMLLFVCSLLRAAPLQRGEVPEPLQPWVDWALATKPEARCPVHFDGDAHDCLWPGRLQLAADAAGVSFSQAVDVMVAGRFMLPGGRGQWPVGVQVDGRAVAVVDVDGRPMVALEPGRHRINGAITWQYLPDTLLIPPGTGMLALMIDGAPTAEPRWRDGRLWLRERTIAPSAPAAPEDRLQMTVARLIADGHPTLLTTELALSVSGASREIVVGRPVADGFVPLRIESSLPARLEPDGRLRVQVRPGDWPVRVVGRRIGGLESLSMTAQPAPWPDEEVWAFAAAPADRTVRVHGVAQIDPRRSTLPDEWHRWPTYRVTPGDTLSFDTQRRGNPEPDADELELRRTFWLDFDGGAYTLHDRIAGQLKRTWRLNAEPALALGRVSLGDDAQFITTDGDGRQGVEVRQGRLELEAVSRAARDGSPLPASGWSASMQKAEAELQTPPGWRVLAIDGVDAADGAWAESWTLFDLFFVLLSTIAAARLWGIGWALVTLIGLALTWQEPQAPALVWLGVMAIASLRRLVPRGGRFAAILAPLWLLAWLSLAVQALPFAVTQARLAIYPQLEGAGTSFDARQVTRPDVVDDRLARQEAAPSVSSAAKSYRRDSANAPAAPMGAMPPPPPIDEADPNAIVQTGPGLPDWRWRRTQLHWNGPVEPGQTIEPWLLSPTVVSSLRLLALMLLAALVWRMFDIGRGSARGGVGDDGGLTGRHTGPGGDSPTARPDGESAPAGPAHAKSTAASAGVASMIGAVASALVAVACAWPASLNAQSMPSQALLDELARRLLEQPHAAPRAALSELRLRIEDETLRLDMQVHALQRSAIPLPVDVSGQWPLAVRLDDRDTDPGLIRTEAGQLWMLVPEGLHTVHIRLPLAGRDTLAMPMPLLAQRVDFEGSGWSLSGLDAQGVPGKRLVLSRERKPVGGSQPQTDTLVPGRLPPLLAVTRTLSLGLQWRIDTTVTRLSAELDALSVAIDLVPGEAVTSDGVIVRDGVARVDLPAGVRAVRWQSRLDPVPELKLTAGRSSDTIETWRVDVGPIWHLDYTGLAPIHIQDARLRWLPTWHPWPGDTLTLAISRPGGASGKTLTIERSALTLTPGAQRTSAELRLRVRASQGQRHRIGLPEQAELESTVINGRSQPLRLDGRMLTLPLDPGTSDIAINWKTPGSMTQVWRTPAVDLGAESVNATIKVETPADRWLVWVAGPRLGPAVLFWGVLVVVVVLAAALARVGRGKVPLGLIGWLLLSVGLMQTSLFLLLPVVAWLALLHHRGTASEHWSPVSFNVVQVLIAVLTLAVALVLYMAVQQSLLGWPDMHIEGNQSTWRQLNWYADRSDPLLPLAMIVSLPMIVYRVLMLLWALWLAFAVLGWLRWAWPLFAAGGFWRRIQWRALGGRSPPERGPGADPSAGGT